MPGVRRLSRSAKALRSAASSPGASDPDGLLTVAGGLYTYAVEEYGKALLIESLPEKGGIVSVPYGEIFRSHQKKFDAAFKDLPAECSMLSQGIFSPIIFSPIIFSTGLEASFSSRTRLLYLDMDRNGDPIAQDPPDAKALARALCGFEQSVTRRVVHARLVGIGDEAQRAQGA